MRLQAILLIAGAVSAVMLLMSGCATFCKLTVTNGTGSGEYAPLQSVAIQANPPATNKAFEIWSGDISGIGNPTNGSTTISMNQIDKTITAMYKSLPIPIPTNWNPYIALDYFQHGNPDENTYREKAIAECAAAGKDCIAVKMAYVPNPELSIHLLWYESDVEKGKFMGTWYVKAKDRGITKWQIDITGLEGEATTIYDRFKAYPAYTVKFVTPDISMLKGILHCDDSGIKTSPPEYR
jgi:uncharacterized protein YceK